MSVTVVLFPRNERANSTKLPTNGEGMHCDITDGCDIFNPRIKLLLSDSYDLGNVGIFYIPMWYRYYDVTGIEYIDGFWWISGEVNVLVSNRSQIGSTKFLWERTSDNSTPYGQLSDNFYPLQSKPTCYKLVSETYPLVSKLDSGSWVVGISGANGLSDYYVFSNALFRSFCNSVFSNVTWMGLTGTDVKDNVGKLMINPMQYITSAFWLPIAPDNVPGKSGTEYVKMGFWDFHTPCFHLRTDTVYTFSINVGVLIKDHPLYPKSGLWYNLPPFRETTIYWYPFGVIPIDTSRALTSGVDGDTLKGTVRIDCNTGQAMLTIHNTEDTFYVGTANMGVPIPLAGNTTDVVGAASSVLGGSIKAFTQDAVGGLMETVSGCTQFFTEQTQHFGSQGSMLTIAARPYAVTRCYQPVAVDGDEFGHPSGWYGKPVINNFYKMYKPHCSVKTKFESDKLNAILEEGFYYE